MIDFNDLQNLLRDIYDLQCVNPRGLPLYFPYMQICYQSKQTKEDAIIGPELAPEWNGNIIINHHGEFGFGSIDEGVSYLCKIICKEIKLIRSNESVKESLDLLEEKSAKILAEYSIDRVNP